MITRTAWVAESALNVIMAEAARKQPLETGGVLAGYWVMKGKEIVVTHATVPGPKAVHHAASFLPDSNYDTLKLAEIYNKSRRLYTYLGDWHSHPDGSSAPSSLDRFTLKKISKHAAARMDAPIMGILGGEKEWLFRVWALKSGIWSIGRSPGVVAFQIRLFAG